MSFNYFGIQYISAFKTCSIMESNLSRLLVTVLDKEFSQEEDSGFDGLSLAICLKTKSKPCTFFLLI